MSSVTNVIVSSSSTSAEIVEALTVAKPGTEWSKGQPQGQFNRQGSGPGAGWDWRNAPEVNLFAATMRAINRDVLFNWLSSLPWPRPETVQLFIKDDMDSIFRVYHLQYGGRWIEVTALMK